ncbi:MAG: hypothetical protein IJU76_03715 [Desulfovibrionaceae bacterium]|nr:hypothetical protein [Desulfovibrionaceae bacterium]
MKRFAQAFVCLFVFALLCVVTDADCAFGAKGARGEKAAIERGSTKSKETKKVKKRSLRSIIKNSPRELRPLPLTAFSSADIAEPGPRW